MKYHQGDRLLVIEPVDLMAGQDLISAAQKRLIGLQCIPALFPLCQTLPAFIDPCSGAFRDQHFIFRHIEQFDGIDVAVHADDRIHNRNDAPPGRVIQTSILRTPAEDVRLYILVHLKFIKSIHHITIFYRQSVLQPTTAHPMVINQLIPHGLICNRDCYN